MVRRDETLPSYTDLTKWTRWPLPTLIGVHAKTPGERLRQRRLELGLTQEEVGRKFGIGRATIGRWERGEGPVPRRYFRALFQVLSSAPSPATYFDLTLWCKALPKQLQPETFGSIGDRIRFRRLELGPAHHELARRLGVGRIRVPKWECGRCKPATRLEAVIERFLMEA